jgi:hypothetical protein
MGVLKAMVDGSWVDISVVAGPKGDTGPTGPVSTVPGPAGPAGPNSVVTSSAVTSLTPVDADQGKMFALTSASAITVTLNATPATSFECHFLRDTAATVTFVASGATIISVGSRVTVANRNGLVTVKKIDGTRWALFGDLG